MSQQNQQVEAFLTYYYKLKSPPQYAVLLKGKWGAGKTWFIRKSMEKLKESGGKSLYISLYGISNSRQIEQEFFRQLHPILGSKGVTVAGRLVKGFVRGSLRVDLDGDGKDDGTVTVGIPDIDLSDFLHDTEGFVLIFDDVERCSIPINDLLGYVNYFVEHGECKAVLVANEDEILEKETDANKPGNAYRRIKEKLIGKTFEVEPDLDGAVHAFINELSSPNTQNVLNKNLELIQDLYVASKYQNLRHLRQAILDYAQLLEILESDALEHEGLLSDLLMTFLIYSFEIKSGAMLPSEIKNIKTSFYDFVASRQNKVSDNLYSKLSSKYVGTSLLDAPLSSELWEEIFSTGLLESQAINATIKASKYLASSNQADWIRLWNAFSLSDEEFELLLEAVSDRFLKNEYQEIGVLRHVVGTLLMLSDKKLYQKTKDEILAAALSNICNMKENGSLRKEFSGRVDILIGTNFSGLGFHSSSTDEFMEFDRRLKELGKEAVEEGYPAEAKDLLELMVSDTRKFCRSLILTNQPGCQYCSVPILQYITPDEFVIAAQKLLSDQLNLVTASIKERYSSDFNNHELITELPWLRDVAHRLKEIKAERDGKISGFLLGWLEEGFTAAAESLEATDVACSVSAT